MTARTTKPGAGLLCALLAVVAGCDREPPSSEAPPATSTVATRTTAPFIAAEHGFSVRYPNGDTPTKVHRGTTNTAIGRVDEFSYYTGVGETAYDVSVSVYPPGKLSPDLPELLKTLRDDALSRPGAKLISERDTFIQTSRGKRLPAHFMEVDMNGARVFRVACFSRNFGYLIGSGGRAEEMSRPTFDAFVDSFRALEGAAL